MSDKTRARRPASSVSVQRPAAAAAAANDISGHLLWVPRDQSRRSPRLAKSQSINDVSC